MSSRYWYIIGLHVPLRFWSAAFTVSTNADSGAGSLRQAILDLNSTGGSSNTITINSGLSTISLSSALPAINRNVDISGPAASQAITANNNQVFFINSTMAVNISNIAISGAKSTGGNGGTGSAGGGGAMGGGGGLFVSAGSTTTISNVTFNSCNATGGTGGNGAASNGGGGGGGIPVSGANAAGNVGGAGGTTGGGGGGGRGGNALAGANAGGAGGGGGAVAGGGGAAGGALTGGVGGNGGAGGSFGGGGGGGQGGNGAVGAGGNGGNGGAGGFGGGGGGGAGAGTSGTPTPGTGGAGGFSGGTGGNAVTTNAGGGGGGAGLGGAIFVDPAGTLVIVTPTTNTLFAGNTVTAGGGGTGSGAGGAGSAGSALGQDLFMASGAVCTFNVPSGTITLTNPIQSNQTSGGSLTKMGLGTLDFSTNNIANTYTGGTIINDGSLSIASDSNLGVAAGGITMGTGVGVTPTLTIAESVSTSRAAMFTGSATGTFAVNSGASLSYSGTVGLSSANLTVNAAASTSSTISGLISGTGGSITKTGLGTLTLSNGSNSYTGGTTLSGGVLSITADGQLGDASGAVTFNGGTLQLGGSFTSARAVSLSTSGAIDTNGSGLTLSGVLSGNGTLNKQGSGTLSLTGMSANTATGTITLSAGGLTLNKTGVNAIAGDLVVNGGTVLLSASNQIADTSTVTLGGGTLNMGGNAETIGTLVFNSGTLSQGGATLSLAGASNALSMRDTTIAGPLSITGGGSVLFDSLNNGTAVISGALNLGGATTVFNIADGAAATDMSISSVISNGGLNKTGAGTLVLSGSSANTYTGLTTVSGGVLNLNKTGVNAIVGNVAVNGGTLSLAAANQIIDTATMTLAGGTFDMGGNGETLEALVFNSGTLTQGGATLTLGSATTALTMRNTTVTGPISLSGGGSVVFDNTNDGTALISGALNLGGSTTTFNIGNGAAATDMSISGAISNGAVTKTGAGLLQFAGSGANIYSGLTTLSNGTLALNKTAGVNAIAGDVTINGGTLLLQAANQLADTTTMTLAGGIFDMSGNQEAMGRLLFNSGTLSQTGAVLTLASGSNALTMRNTSILGPVTLSGGGSVVFDSANNGTALISGGLNLGGATITFNIADGAAATDLSMSGSITNGAILKIGSGHLSFSGSTANTYSGTTTVNSGLLTLNKTSGIDALSGDIVINGGTLLLAASGQIPDTSNLTLSGGTFDMAGHNETMGALIFNSGTLSQASATLGLASATTALTMRDTTISGPLAFSGGGSVVFDDTNDGTAMISGSVNLGGSTIVFDIADGTAAVDMNVMGAISNGAVTKTGAGTLTFLGGDANTYTGVTSVNAGTLSLNKGAVNAIAGNVSINGGTLLLEAENQIVDTSVVTLGGGTFDMGGHGETVGALVFQSGSLTQGGAVLTLASSADALTMRDTTIAGPLALTGGGSVVFDAANNGTAAISGALNLGAQTNTFNIANGAAATDMNLSGVVSNGSLTKTGAGTLLLSGSSANTYAGLTTLANGTLVLNKTGVNAIAGNVAVNGGTLSLAAANQIINTATMTLAGGTFDMGGNGETLAALVFNSGALTQGGATLTLGSATTALTMRNTTITGPIALTGGGSIVFDPTNNGTATINGSLNLGGFTTLFDVGQGAASTDLSVGGVIASGALNKTGLGTLALSGTNTFSGGITISQGTLSVGTDANLGQSSGSIAFNGGTLIFSGSSFSTNRSLSLTGSGTLHVSSGPTTITLGGAITGGGAFSTAGLGTVSLSGTMNTYTGSTTIQAGSTLSLAADGAFTTGSSDTTVGGVFRLNGHDASVATLSGSGQVELGSATLTSNSASPSTFSGEIHGTGGFTKNGGGVLIFSGSSANSYTGLTRVQAGTLTFNKTSAQAAGGNLQIDGGSLTLAAAAQMADTATLTLNGGTFNMAGFAETIDTLVFNSGTLSQSGAVFTLSDLTLRDVAISGPLQLVNSPSILFDSTNNGTAMLNGDILIGDSLLLVDVQDGSALTDLSITGVISGSAGMTKTGVGLLNLGGSAANTFTGLTTINAGWVSLAKTAGVNAIAGNLLVTSGTLGLAAANQISDTATLTLSGGTFDMAGFNETLGSLVFNSGTLSQTGATLSLSSSGTALTMQNSTLTANGVVNITGGGQVVFDSANNGTATIACPLGLGGSTVSFDIANGLSAVDMSVSGSISNGALTKSGTGALEFVGAAANTYTGLTTIGSGTLLLNKAIGVNAIAGNALISGGTLLFGNSEQISSSSTVTLNSGILNLAGFSETIGSFVFNGGTCSASGATLTVNNLTMRNTSLLSNLVLTSGGTFLFDTTNNGTASLDGTISLGGGTTTWNIGEGAASIDTSINSIISNGALTKTGAGTLQLTGSIANTYTGMTTLSAGTLILNKPAGISAVAGDATVNGGALLLAAANQISSSATLTLNGGVFDLQGHTEDLGTLVFNGGTLSQGGGELHLTSASNALSMANVTISGPLSITGGGSVVFNNMNNGTAVIGNSLNLGGSAIAFNIADGAAATDMSIAGVISNGSVIKTGAGTLTLSGTSANTYTGTTTVQSGVLNLSKTTLPAAPGDVSIQGGTLAVSSSGQISSSSTLTLSGGTFNMGGFATNLKTLHFQSGLLSQGGATLTLNDSTTALTVRNTTISGNLQLTGGGAILFNSTQNGTGLISGNIDLGGSATEFRVANGTANTDLSITGVISNGGVIKTGLGLLQLTGANTYAGNTVIEEGILSIAADSNLGNSAGTLTLINGTLQITQPISIQRPLLLTGDSEIATNMDVLFPDAISGSGTMTKRGAGLCTFDGAVAQNAIFIEEGGLSVNSTVSADVTIAALAYLQGTGTVIGNVVNQGQVAPGNSIGTLSISGDYVQATGSTLEIEISPTESDLLSVSGVVSIEPGAALTVNAGFGTYQNNLAYTIITSGGGIVPGQEFTTITISPPSLMLSAFYFPNEIKLLLNILPFTSIVSTGNPGAVAAALDAIPPNYNPEVQTVIDYLLFLSPSDLYDALNQLQPSLFTGLTVVEQQAATLSVKEILRHLEEIDPCGGDFQLWATSVFDQAFQSSAKGEAGWTSYIQGIWAGLDQMWTENLSGGVAFGYEKSKMLWHGGGTKAHFRTLSLNLYTRWAPQVFYMDLIASGGVNYVHGSRHIQFAALDEVATHSAENPWVQGCLELGLRWPLGTTGQFRLFANGDYLYLDEKGYCEENAPGMNLCVQKEKPQILAAECGMTLSHGIFRNHYSLVPEAKVSWIGEKRFNGDTFTAYFQGTEPLFTVQGLYPSRQALGVGGKVTYDLFNRLSFTLRYDAEIAHRYFEQTFSFQANARF